MPETPFQCDECDKSFTKNHGLLTHKRMKHAADAPFVEPVADVQVVAKPQREQRETLPPYQIGVSESMAVRTIKMAAPICPIPSMPNQPGYDPTRANCQRKFNGRIGWWLECEEAGHDPYFTKRERIREEQDWARDDNGEEYLRGTKKVREVVRLPNIVQVALSERIDSGQKVETSRRRKGRRFLTDVGYDPVCEYRNCERGVKVKTIYGNYCGERHARLIGADVEHIALEVHPDNAADREKQLRQIALYA